MHRGVDPAVLRDRFEDFLRHFRPRDLGELLQVPLSRQVPMWVLPWDAHAPIRPNGGWLDDAAIVVDIMTHYCERGILRSKIDREYVWLEGPTTRSRRWATSRGDFRKSPSSSCATVARASSS